MRSSPQHLGPTSILKKRRACDQKRNVKASRSKKGEKLGGAENWQGGGEREMPREYSSIGRSLLA